jgi:hypothetical protein
MFGAEGQEDSLELDRVAQVLDEQDQCGVELGALFGHVRVREERLQLGAFLEQCLVEGLAERVLVGLHAGKAVFYHVHQLWGQSTRHRAG